MTAEELERSLGPASDGWRDAVEADEREAFPEALVARLQQHHFLSLFVPRAEGGQLDSFVDTAASMRAVARRDLTAAIALGQCFLGSVPVWLDGSSTQRARMAQLLRDGRLTALALTEQAHGSDLMATEVGAADNKLTGTKWLINNATRATALSVFARTASEGGLGGFTIFLFDKQTASPGSFSELQKVKTHGIRGADISGLTFANAEATPVGKPGSGLELALRALQVTRIGCAAFSLGAADTALRVAMDFARARTLYGAPVWNIAHARWVLTTAFVDLLICEALSYGAWRGLHTAPEQMSLSSAVVKYLVPTRCEQAIRDVGVVLGARHYLRDQQPTAIFQKMVRDAGVVSLFDGSTAVNLDGIGLQLPRLRAGSANADHLAARFNLTAALPAFDGSRLQLMNAGIDDVVQGLPEAIQHLEGEARQLADRVQQQVIADRAALESLDRTSLKRSATLFHFAARYATHHAAASCVHFWHHNRAASDSFLTHPAWLVAALHRLLDDAPHESPTLSTRLESLHASKRSFSFAATAAP